MGCKLGTTVGYAVRFDQKVDQRGGKTLIKFVTDGLLLRETLYDPLLSSYSVIMLDEAHERSMCVASRLLRAPRGHGVGPSWTNYHPDPSLTH